MKSNTPIENRLKKFEAMLVQHVIGDTEQLHTEIRGVESILRTIRETANRDGILNELGMLQGNGTGLDVFPARIRVQKVILAEFRAMFPEVHDV